MSENNQIEIENELSSSHLQDNEFILNQNNENNNEINNEEDEKKEEEDIYLDDFGMKKYYDLIVYGTGILQSLVAAAASKRGKSVLHLDQNEFYGSDSSSYTLSEYFKLFSKKNSLENKLNEENKEETIKEFSNDDELFLYVDGTDYLSEVKPYLLSSLSSNINSLYTSKLTSTQCLHPSLLSLYTTPRSGITNNNFVHSLNMDEELSQLKNNNKEFQNPTLNQSQIHPAYYPYISPASSSPILTQLRTKLLSKDRDFSLSPGLKILFSQGDFVKNLIRSGVSNYLEFKSVDKLYFLTTKNKPTFSKTSTASPLYKWEIPFSKSSIFMSTDLGPIEKRNLMKLNQYITDNYYIEKNTLVSSKDSIPNKSSESVEVVNNNIDEMNEKVLSTGRSLYRPQNKKNELKVSDESKDQVFSQFLKKEFGFSEKISDLIIYGCCFFLGNKNATKSEKKLYFNYLKAMDALQIFSNSVVLSQSWRQNSSALSNSETVSPLISPLYSFSEMLQGFCRVAAVWGATYVLRRGIKQIERVDEKNLEEKTKDYSYCVTDSEGNKIFSKKVLLNSSSFLNKISLASSCASQFLHFKKYASLNMTFLLYNLNNEPTNFLPCESGVGIITSDFITEWNKKNNDAIELNYPIYCYQMDDNMKMVTPGVISVQSTCLIDLDYNEIEQESFLINDWLKYSESLKSRSKKIFNFLQNLLLKESSSLIVFSNCIIKPIIDEAFTQASVEKIFLDENSKDILISNSSDITSLSFDVETINALSVYNKFFEQNQKELFDENNKEFEEDEENKELNEYEEALALALENENNEDAENVNDQA